MCDLNKMRPAASKEVYAPNGFMQRHAVSENGISKNYHGSTPATASNLSRVTAIQA